jgi:hypothetical protein
MPTPTEVPLNTCPICVSDHEKDPEYPIRACATAVRLTHGWWHVCHECAGRVAELLESKGGPAIVLAAPSARAAFDEALPYAGVVGALAIARGVQAAVHGAVRASLRPRPRGGRKAQDVALQP